MTTEEIKDTVIALIAELFEDKGFDTDILEYADMIDDMGMDSITFISMIVELEDKFNITVPERLLRMEYFKKIDGIVKIVEHEWSCKKAETGGVSDAKA